MNHLGSQAIVNRVSASPGSAASWFPARPSPATVWISAQAGCTSSAQTSRLTRGLGGLGTSLREEREAKSQPRQDTQEGQGRGGDRAVEQVPGAGQGCFRQGGYRPDGAGLVGGEDYQERILQNKSRQIYRVLFFNARSIVSKVDILQTELLARSSQPDIICVCETFCSDQHTDAYLGLTGYESRRDGRDTTNGITRGLLIYCRIGIKASELPG